MIALRSSLRFAAALVLSAALLAQNTDLRRGFQNPPDSARPWTYWFWMNGNLTRQGITADLEAMHRVGIRGVIILDVDVWVPKGPITFLTPEWRSMFQFALKEASRLGMEVSMGNDSSWAGSGGPWITPALSMQMVVSSETQLSGPRHIEQILPRPKATNNYYREIAVLAFPTPATDLPSMAEASPKFTFGTAREPLDAAKLTDGSAATTVSLPKAATGEPTIVEVSFPKPFTAESITIALEIPSTGNGTLEVSSDGQSYRSVRSFFYSGPITSLNFDRTTARYFRLSFVANRMALQDGLTIGEINISPGRRLESFIGKATYRDDVFLTSGSSVPGSAVRRDAVRNISANMTADGRLSWDVPAGHWTILRLGHTSTGKMNHTGTAGGLGLECDRLSKQALDVHFDGLIAKLLEDQRQSGAKSLAYAHIDSWEAGSQNWTPQFRQEFQKRRGYDILPYLPLLTGRLVESPEVSERVLWDLRRTVKDLLLENYAGHFRDLTHRHGIKFSLEAYGAGPLDDLEYAGYADLPISEFWMGMPSWWLGREMTSAAHTYGRPVIAAESFTSRSAAAKWTNYPFRLKPFGDEMFTQGINRFIFHRYTMQPRMDIKPGLSMGPYGIHFERTNTWWEQSRAWLEYIARCQYLLQQGTFVADIAYLGAQRLPNDNHDPLATNLALPAGYDYDMIPVGLLLNQLSISGGKLTLPSGMTYRALVLPSAASIPLEQLRKIRQLVEGGATIIGPPPSKSPGLAGYPGRDAEIQKLASELWGAADGSNIVEHSFGKGKVVWGKPLTNVLSDAAVPQDFRTIGSETGSQIRYIHRYAGGKDIYFLASAEGEATTFLCDFRVTGKRPQLWHPDSGRIENVAVFEERDQQTRMPVRLDPYGSVFVVFEKDASPKTERLAMVTRDGVDVTGLNSVAPPDLRTKLTGFAIEAANGRYRLEASEPGLYRLKAASGKTVEVNVAPLPAPLEVTGSWQLSFPTGSVTFDRLVSWTAHQNDAIKYFSGMATYTRQLEVPAAMLGPSKALYLDLGRVAVIAEVRLNGHDLGILWKPPYRVDISATAHAGSNDLEVKVVNLWPNRMIGDDRLPQDSERDGARLKSWPQWLLDGKPSPTGRQTFATWNPWTKDDTLLESGLLGPVILQPAIRLEAGFDTSSAAQPGLAEAR